MVLRGDVDADEGGEDDGDCVIDDDDADDDDDLSPFGLSNCINSESERERCSIAIFSLLARAKRSLTRFASESSVGL